MTYWTLIRRSLRFHARTHFGVVLGAAIGSTALIGALVVGDSLRGSLKQMALSRLGKIHFALNTRDRLFQADLGNRLCGGRSWTYGRFDPSKPGGIYSASSCPLSEALGLPGVVSRPDGTARANRVAVFGVETRAWPRMADWGKLSPGVWVTTSAAVTNTFRGVTRIRLPESAEVLRQQNLDGVIGMDREHGKGPLSEWRTGETAFINETLARQLKVTRGDEFVLRVQKPSALAHDAVITPRNEGAVAIHLKVGAILTPDMLEDFSLTAGQALPANVFVPLEFLNEKLGVSNRANLLFEGAVMQKPESGRWDGRRARLAQWLLSLPPRSWGGPPPDSIRGKLARAVTPRTSVPARSDVGVSWLNKHLEPAWVPEDAGIIVRTVEPPQSATGGEYIRPSAEVASSRIFIEPSIAKAALTQRTKLLTNRFAYPADSPNDIAFARLVTNGVSILTYLANLIQNGDRATPYSMVTAANGEYVPVDLRDDEILINQWLADDLNAKPGDRVQISYYVVDTGSRLVECTNTFRVRQIVPVRGIYADRTLMPEFPGLAKAESTHDWDAGFPLVHTIRDKDEAYWKEYRGTPKAFITLAAGQAMWANRFGKLTAIRYPVPTNTFASTCRDAVYRNLLANLNPTDFGFRFEPVREEVLKAAEQSQDFGQLFLGFSIFLVVAALLLMALLFQFGLEQRIAELGTLLALGFTPRQVRRLLLAEGAALALLGGVIGALGGIAYAKAMLWGLTTIWQRAVGMSALEFHVTAISLVIGLCAAVVVGVLTMWLTLRKQARRPARELLAGEVQTPKSKTRSWGAWIAWGAGVAALGIVGWALVSGESANAEFFFSAGALLLVAGLGASAGWMGRLSRAGGKNRFTLGGLGWRGCGRRRTRSLATIALLASGCFVIAAIGVFRLDANQNATRKSSGTGGFALIGESTIPVVQDLNTESGREFFGLSERDLESVSFVPIRVHDGDDASCLNLNRAQQPRLLSVKPEMLMGRFAFTSTEKGTDSKRGWELLRGGKHYAATNSALRTPHSTVDQSLLTSSPTLDDEIPAIGDANSIQWALHKKIGDTIDYTDERGRSFKLRLVGAVANSILQGNLIIDEAEFIKRFPSESGHRMFLIDAPSNSVTQVSATLARALQDVGLELTPAAERLNAFNAVQNTYLGTFQVLGGLGLLLGSAGLGVVVLRNVLERRGELGLLTAIGFRRRELQRLVLSEHGLLLGVGLGLGILAAAVAVLPAVLSSTGQLPYTSLALTLGAVCGNGLLWTWLATRYALRGSLLGALRNE